MRFLRAGLVLGAIAGAFGLSFLSGTGAQPPGTDSFSICSRSDVISPPAAGSCIPVSATNPLPVDATVNASIAGFEPGATGTPVAADIDGDTQTLPAGQVVAVFNKSTSITAYCNLGASATVNDAAIPPSSWFAFTVGAATQITCITASSTATLNTVGGTGLPTGAGGGGGGSSSNTSVSATGAAVPADATYLGINTGGNLVGWTGAVTVASGGIASGAIASGAVASGAFASGALASGAVSSGAFASGALASGSIAAGAQVDLLTMRGTKAPGTAAANSLLGGCIYNSGGVTLTDGQQAAVQCNSAGGALVSVTNTNANGQATMANSSPVTLASNQQVADPCTFRDKSTVAISTAADATIVSASASNKVYVCSLTLIAGAAEIVNLVEGTGTVCDTGAAAVMGSTTSANGLSLAANGGLTLGNGGGTVAKTAGTNVQLCLMLSTTNRVAGNITYVLAP